MISKETIEEVKNRLVKTYDPIAIYRFGSYARGPLDDETLDLVSLHDEVIGQEKRSIVMHKGFQTFESSTALSVTQPSNYGFHVVIKIKNFFRFI